MNTYDARLLSKISYAINGSKRLTRNDGLTAIVEMTHDMLSKNNDHLACDMV